MNILSDIPIKILASGGFRMLASGQDEVRIPSKKGTAIVAYLAFSEFSRATRDKLASLLWSESSNTAARTALRQCLHQLKAHFPTTRPDALQITSEFISLKRENIVTDLDFINASADQKSPINLTELPDPNRLLEGFDHLDESYGEWLRNWRTEVDGKIRSRLVHLIKSADVEHGSRLEAAECLNRIDPADEIAARYLIQEQARNSNLAGLLRIYGRLWDKLDEDWDEEPTIDLQNFVADVRTKLGDSASAKTLDVAIPPALEGHKRRCFVTVMVVRIQLAKSSMAMDIEEVEDLLRVSSSKMSEVLKGYGGQVSKNFGSDIIAIFGYPNASEEDSLNALGAALELRDGFERNIAGKTKASLKVGIDSGLVFVQHQGGENLFVDMVGDPVDSALELVRRRDSPMILATARSARRLNAEFVVATEAALVESDKSIISVLGRRPLYNPSDVEPLEGSRDFVGRDPSLATLEAAWDEADRGNAQVVSVVGDPGIGKTRLVGEFLRRHKQIGHTVYFLRCNRHDRSAPLEPMRALDSSVRLDSAMRAQASADVSRGRQHKLSFSALADDMIEALSRQGMIIAFDDWQWADDASRKMLSKLVKTLNEERLLILLTSREDQRDDPTHSMARKIALSAMTDGEVAQIADGILGWRMDGAIKDYVHTKSGGNPLLLEEICLGIAHQAKSGSIDGIVNKLPASLQALIVSRVERMSGKLREIVEAAAVHGDKISTDLLEEVVGAPLDQTTIAGLVETGLLLPVRQNATFRFKHGIARDVVYDMIDLVNRRKLHATFAEALKREAREQGLETPVEQLALHYRGAGDFERGTSHAERAGDNAFSVSSLDLAKTQLASALEMLDQCEPSEDNQRRWLSIVLRWGVPCVYAPSREQLPVFTRAAQIAKQFDDTASMAQVYHWMGYITHVLGDHSDAIRKLSHAIEFARDADNRRVLAEATATRGFAYAARCEYGPAQKDITFAIAAKDRNPGRRSRTPVLSSYARATLAVIRADQGDFAGSHELIDEALDRVRGSNHEIESSICNMGSAVLLWQGRWRDAYRSALQSLKISEAVGSAYLIGMARCLVGYANWRKTGDAESIEMLCSAAERLWSAEMRLYSSFSYGWISDASLAIGRTQAAYNAAIRTLDLAEQGDAVGAAMACRTLAALSAVNRSEGLAQALVHLRNAELFADRRNSPHEHAINQLHSARIHAIIGDRNAAFKHIDRCKSALTDLTMTWHCDRATALEGRLASGKLAAECPRVTDFGL